MDDPLYIDDSYTRTSVLKAEPGLYPRVEIVYRPCLPEIVAKYSAIDIKQVEAIEEFRGKLLREHLITLNSQKCKDVRRLEPNVRIHVCNLIMGFDPARPDAPTMEESAGNSSGASDSSDSSPK